MTMPLQFTNSHRTILRNAKLSGLIPLDEEEFASSKFFYIAYDLLILMLLTWKLICAAFSIFSNDYEDMMLAQCIGLITFSCFLISIYYVISRNGIRRLIANCDHISKAAMESRIGETDYYAKLFSEDSRLLCLMNKITCSYITLNALLYCISVPIVGYALGDPVYKLPIPIRCAFEIELQEFYAVFLFFQYVGMLIPGLQKLSNEFMMFSIFKIQSAHFKYLTELMKVIGSNINVERKNETRKKLILWTKMHQDAMRNIREIQKVFSPIIVVYYVTIISIVAGGLFYHLNAENANVMQGTTVGVYILLTILQFYILCHLAEELATEAENIAVTVYRLPWYNLDIRSSMFVSMVIKIANKPLSITAYHSSSFIISRETFLAFMVNIVSAYMGFRRVKEME